MSKNEQKERDFSAILANAGTGTTIQIKRLQPTWCDGILVEEEIDPNDRVDLEHIREQWGGRKLTLTLRENGLYKTSTTLKFPDPPKKDGTALINPEIAAQALPPPPAPPPAPPPDDSGKLLEIVLNMQNAQAAALAEIQKTAADTIAEAQQISAQTQQQTLEAQITELKKQIQEMGEHGGRGRGREPEKSALEGIKEMASTMKEIEEIRGTFGGGGGGEGSDFLSEGIKQFMGLEMEKKKMEMGLMMKKMELQQGQGEGTTAPPLKERPKIEAGQATEESAPNNLPAAAAPMLSAFQAIPVKQQAALVSAHLEQLGDEKRMEFLNALSESDFIEEEEEEEEEEIENASPPPETTADEQDDKKTTVDEPIKSH